MDGSPPRQTTFLVIADMTYPKTNLEHAAASVPNMLQGALVMTLFATLLLGVMTPQFHLYGIHPVTILMFCGYGFGLKLVRRSHQRPMWRPRMTVATRKDIPDEEPASGRKVIRTWLDFAVTGSLLVGGLLVALTLAVGNVLGGNAFDTLFAAVADFAYRPGPIYAAVSWRESTMITLTIIMSGVLLLGLLSRERRGPANIGF